MFGRKNRSVELGGLPIDTVERMAAFGAFEFSPMDSTLDGGYVWENLQAPYLALAQADPDKFIADLGSHVVPAGGWSAYGAHRTIASLLSPETQHPVYDQILGTALRFLRSEGVSADRLNDYEHRFWRANDGQADPWT